MKKRRRIIWTALLAAVLSVSLCACGGEDTDPYAAVMQQTQDYIVSQMTDPTYGDEWYLIGLLRSDAPGAEDCAARYEENLTAWLQDHDGVLDARKRSEYSKVILALTAMGKAPTDVAGYDLLAQLADLDQVCLQGVNGPIWALIALDSGAYEPAIAPNQKDRRADRTHLLDEILRQEIPGGGFALTGGQADPDMTGMALQALAPYAEQPEVQAVIDRALAVLSEMQLETGGFVTIAAGTETTESDAQVLVALTTLGIDPTQDERFVKDGKTVLDALLQFALEDGSFCHDPDGAMTNSLSTGQAYYALTAYSRFLAGQSPLYQMAA